MTYGVFAAVGDTYSFANLADLIAFDDTGILDGTIVYVTTIRSYFQKRIVSPVPTTDGITVVPTQSGDGAWYRLTNVASQSWATDRVIGNAVTWYVDPVNGDDENDGSSSAAGGPLAVPPYVGAIKTVAEFARRLLYLQRGVTYTVQLLGDVPDTDSLDFTGRILLGTGTASSTLIGFLGVETLIQSASQITAIAQTNGATATQASCTDAARAWIVPTNGTPTPQIIRYLNAGVPNYAFVLKDTGGGSARLGHIFVPSTTSPFNFATIAASVPATPLAYDLVTLSGWAAPVVIDGPFRVVFRSLNFAGLQSDRFSVANATLTHVLCAMCRVAFASGGITYANAARNGYGGSVVNYNACFIGNDEGGVSFAATNPGGRISTSLCAFMGVNLVMNNTAITKAWAVSNCTLQGGIAGLNRAGRILAGATGGPLLGGATFALDGIVSFFDWQQAGGAIEMNSGAQVAGTNLSALFGSQSPPFAGYGVRIRGGARFLLPASLTPQLNSNGAGGAYDVDLDGLGGANGTATAIMQRPLPGALWAATPATNGYSVALNAAGGAGWVAWAAARAVPGLERYAVGHVTGATLVGV